MELDQSEMRKPKPGDAKGEREKERERANCKGSKIREKSTLQKGKTSSSFLSFSIEVTNKLCVCVC